MSKIEKSAAQGYARTFQERQANDISIAAAVTDAKGLPIAAVNVAASTLNYTLREAEKKFSTLVQATARSISPKE